MYAMWHVPHINDLKNWIKQMHPAAFYFSCTYTYGISLRIIINDYIITQSLINETVSPLIGFAIANPKPVFKAVLFWYFDYFCVLKILKNIVI